MDYPSLEHLHYQSPTIHEITSDQVGGVAYFSRGLIYLTGT